MKSKVWTYVNKKPKVYSVDRYHYVKNEKDLGKLIGKLLDIDAVISPSALNFPVLLEVKDGFTPTLTIANVSKMRKELKKLQSLIEKADKDATYNG